MKAQDDRVVKLHRLHASGCSVMPNPWDVGSALALEQIGFAALAAEVERSVHFTLPRPT